MNNRNADKLEYTIQNRYYFSFNRFIKLDI